MRTQCRHPGCTLLNFLQKQPGFVYASVTLKKKYGLKYMAVRVRNHGRSKPICSGCAKKRKAYDHLPERNFQFVPLWAIAVFFVYAPRRCDCPRCGIKVELLPWANGKSPMCTQPLRGSFPTGPSLFRGKKRPSVLASVGRPSIAQLKQQSDGVSRIATQPQCAFVRSAPWNSLERRATSTWSTFTPPRCTTT
jgi:hypothetical protein